MREETTVVGPRGRAGAGDRARGIAICDGEGGHLGLDLRDGELRWLAEACRRLVSGTLPPGTSAIKVSAAERCYLVRRVAGKDAEPRIAILNVFDPGERVALTRDVAAMVAALIEDGAAREG